MGVKKLLSRILPSPANTFHTQMHSLGTQTAILTKKINAIQEVTIQLQELLSAQNSLLTSRIEAIQKSTVQIEEMIIPSLGGMWSRSRVEFENAKSRGKVFWDIVAEHFPAKMPIDILEIGVYQGNLLRSLMSRNDITVKNYTGVDPYLGTMEDPYLKAYWQNEDESDKIYQNSLKIFKSYGYSLVRAMSTDFFASNTSQYDLVIIDGDHRYEPAYKDCCQGFEIVKRGGLLIVDDYGNSDTPEVTNAVNRFYKENQRKVNRFGWKVWPFKNANKFIPISLTFVYFEKP